MSTFSLWVQVHRRSILFLVLILAADGRNCLQIARSTFPECGFPRVVVSLDAGDRAAELMELQVTRPVEEAVRSIPGVISVRSGSSRGSADISINFDWGVEHRLRLAEFHDARSRLEDLHKLLSARVPALQNLPGSNHLFHLLTRLQGGKLPGGACISHRCLCGEPGEDLEL